MHEVIKRLIRSIMFPYKNARIETRGEDQNKISNAYGTKITTISLLVALELLASGARTG